MLFWCSISSLKQCPLTGSQICKSEIQHGVTGFSAQGITRLQSSYLRPEFGNSKENPLPSSYFKLVEFSPSLFPFPGRINLVLAEVLVNFQSINEKVIELIIL